MSPSSEKNKPGLWCRTSRPGERVVFNPGDAVGVLAVKLQLANRVQEYGTPFVGAWDRAALEHAVLHVPAPKSGRVSDLSTQ